MSTTVCSPALTQQLSTQALEDDFGPSGNIVVDDVPGNNTIAASLSATNSRRGGSDDDELRGESSDDTLEGAEGNDDLNGDSGNDRLFGNQGNDRCHGDSGNDDVAGGQGNDTIEGNQDQDTLYGNLAEDSLLGGQGNDSLHGGQGNDTITGGQGNDDLNGGLGDDRFIYAAGITGEDDIFGFQGAGVAGGDVVQLAASLLGGASIGSLLTVDGNNTLLRLEGGLEIEFKQTTGLTADDFAIV